MSKFNLTPLKRLTGAGPVSAETTPTGRTHEGGAGYAHDAKSELFLLAVSNFVGEDTFYERAADRDRRYTDLVRRVAVDDPDWTARFLHWLRTDAYLRSASLTGGLEAALALRDAGIPGGRRIVDSVLQRADEPGEALAYWMTTQGRALPKPVKRGIADAAARLYTERALLKYDTASHAFRFGDVLDLTHPAPGDGKAWQGALFAYALERRHARESAPPAGLTTVLANRDLRRRAERDPSVLLDPDALAQAGMTWEDALSLGGNTGGSAVGGSAVDRKRLWEAMIPSMGFMALLRNLRNFDEAGVGDDVAERICARFADPGEIARSKQFPYRFLAAYENAPSLRWGPALDRALQQSLSNLPALRGRSLILVDTSGSMVGAGLSGRSTMSPVKAAAVFAVALAARGERVDLHGFADGTFRHDVRRGASVIREVDRFVRRVGEVGHGTRIASAIRDTFRAHDRVVVISDLQTFADGEVTRALPREVPLYGFNLGGYRRTAFDAGSVNRIEFGGLTDATFRTIPLIEAGKRASWPF